MTEDRQTDESQKLPSWVGTVFAVIIMVATAAILGALVVAAWKWALS